VGVEKNIRFHSTKESSPVGETKTCIGQQAGDSDDLLARGPDPGEKGEGKALKGRMAKPWP